MRRDQLAHLVRAAGAILGVDEVVVVGSQSVLGTWSEEELPDVTVLSVEANLLTIDGSPAAADLLDGSIGELSPFHDAFGIYAQGVDLTTSRLPDGWRGRLVTFRRPDTMGVTGLCLEPHDLWVAKQLAGRPQDRRFCGALLSAGLLDRDVLHTRVDGVDASPVEREMLLALIG